MAQNVYSEFFDQVVRINSTCYRDSDIVDVNYSIYTDFNPTYNCYIFDSSKKMVEGCSLANLGCVPDRLRKDVLFEKEDVYPFILRKVEEWCNKKPYRLKNIIQEYDQPIQGGYVMRLRSNSYFVGVDYVYLSIGESYRNPYQVKSNGCVLKEGDDLEEVLKDFYLFNEEDIWRLAEDFDAISCVK